MEPENTVLNHQDFADPNVIYPRKDDPTICYLKNIVKNPNIIAGDYSFYHDFDDPLKFESKNVLYHYPVNGDRLIIGKFCSIACGTRFIMNGANHKLASFTTYPFPVFYDAWMTGQYVTEAWDNKGDIVVGNDVWIGFECLIMPGVTIGDGAIIASRSVVTRDVPPYTIVGGAPARTIRKRFNDEIVEILMTLKWWDWSPEKIRQNARVLCSNDSAALKELLNKS
ncbi:MAG: CatB-related O-acetyltransferase [Bacteroidota bacterium]